MKFFFTVYDCYGMGEHIRKYPRREGLVLGVTHLFHVISFFLYGYELAIDEPL